METSTSLRSILIFDDDEDLRLLVKTYLSQMFEGVDLFEYDPIESGVPSEDFDWSKYDVLILDYYLCIQGVTGLDILHMNRKNTMFPATIMLTGAGNEEIAVKALKAGVYDYLRKDQFNKEILKKSILNAWESHKGETEKLKEQTCISRAFNTALFYQELENTHESDIQGNRLILLIELDSHEAIEQGLGVIIRDNIIRHIAKRSYQVFNIGGCNLCITRFGDAQVALLIDEPESQSILELKMDGLCEFLKKNSYIFEGKELQYTVSIGVVDVAKKEETAELLIQYAKSACQIAGQQEGNSYHIYKKPDKTSQTRDTDINHEEQATPETDIDSPDEVQQAATKKKLEILADSQETKPPIIESAKATKQEEPFSEDDESELDKSDLDEAALQLKKAFDDKRVIQMFQPVISLFSDEQESEQEVYSVSLQLVDTDGSIIHADEINAMINTPTIQKFMDRWMLREAIGRAVNSKNKQYIFLLKISEASLADATLFNFLRKLLSGITANDPGRSIALEISAADFSAKQKQASALISYLKKSHGFRFVLGYISNIGDVSTLTQKSKFDLVKVHHDMVSELRVAISEEEKQSTILQQLKSKGTNIIADNINNATMLTDIISFGADYAMGDFIGEATDQFEEITNLEYFDIT